MTLGEMLTRWRGRVQEVASNNWSDAEGRQFLNMGLQEVQKHIIAIDPMAFFWTDRTNIVAGQELYPWPSGCLYEFEVAVLGDDGVTYEPLERIAFMETRVRDTASDLAYASHGRHFALSPKPSASVANGLQVKYMPTLTMSGDAVVPDVPIPLHILIVMYAERFALADVGDWAGREGTTKEIAELVGGIPRFYLRSASTPDRMRVDVELGY